MVLAGATAATALLWPATVFAQSWWESILDYGAGIATAGPNGLLLASLYIVSGIVNVILRVAAALLNYVASGAFLAYPITQYPVVQIGWRITRDFANMAFVIILLWLALTTILRLEKYGSKELIIRLVVIALIINFSLVIGGVLIDASNRVMLVFLDPLTKGGRDGAAVILTGSNLIKSFGDNPLTFFRASRQLAAIVQAVFELFFTVVMTGAILVIAALMVVRIVYFWYLLILAPVAWLSWAFPVVGEVGGAAAYKRWWDTFVQWMWWGPTAAFWLLIAAIAAQTLHKLPNQYAVFTAASQSSALAKIPSAMLTTLAPLLQYTVVVFFLFRAIAAMKKGAGEHVSGYVDKAMTKMTGDYLRKPARAAWRATGVPGGVKQRWEQIKERGFKIGGRQLYGGTKAREAREAVVAQALGKKRAYERVRESRAWEDVKGARETTMATLTNAELVELTHNRNVTTAAGMSVEGKDENPAAAAQELISTRRDYFRNINTGAGGGPAGYLAEQLEHQRLRQVMQRYTKKPPLAGWRAYRTAYIKP
ncbi:hypothetical protein HY573_00615 [Candidatus Parcubacteria bacterium]|nr:hypothetical protein [Candidatus Parcubacteria bacterium]